MPRSFIGREPCRFYNACFLPHVSFISPICSSVALTLLCRCAVFFFNIHHQMSMAVLNPYVCESLAAQLFFLILTLELRKSKFTHDQTNKFPASRDEVGCVFEKNTNEAEPRRGQQGNSAISIGAVAKYFMRYHHEIVLNTNIFSYIGICTNIFILVWIHCVAWVNLTLNECAEKNKKSAAAKHFCIIFCVAFM